MIINRASSSCGEVLLKFSTHRPPRVLAVSPTPRRGVLAALVAIKTLKGVQATSVSTYLFEAVYCRHSGVTVHEA